MKNKIKILSALLLITLVFLPSVFAIEFSFGNYMKDDNEYRIYSINDVLNDNYDYLSPNSEFYDKDKYNVNNIEVVGGDKQLTNTLDLNGNNMYGVTAKFAAPNNGITNFTNSFVKFKKLYKIDNQYVDVKVTLEKIESTVDNNEIRIYVNQTNRPNGDLIHRYLGFGIFNGDSETSGDILTDQAYVKIEFYKADTDELYKNSKLIYYFNDVDGNIESEQVTWTDLIQLPGVSKENIYLASNESELKINSGGQISSTFTNVANLGWLDPNTQKVSVLVKNDPNLKNNAQVRLAFGRYSTQFSHEANTSRGGQTDIQFLAPIPFSGTKEYTSDTTSGSNHAPVKIGDIITYKITLTSQELEDSKLHNSNSVITSKITDTLSRGLEYVDDSSNIGNPTITKNSDGTTKLVWNTNFNYGTTKEVTYKVKVVSGYVQNKILNDAYGRVSSVNYHLGKLENPVPGKDYASDTPNGINHEKVKKGDVIKYSIKYSNVLKEAQKVKIVDTISRGLTYKKDSSTIGDAKMEPVIIQNMDGSYTLTWEKEIPANSDIELTYSVDVVGDVKQVNNRASMYYARIKADGTFDEYGDEIFLNELINPLEATVPVPNTARNMAISILLIGITLVGVGGFIIYRKRRRI